MTMNTQTQDYDPTERIDHRATNQARKLDLLQLHFAAKLLSLGLDPYSVEGCEVALAFIDKATPADWDQVVVAAKLKSRPVTTIPLLRAVYEQRLRTAGGGK